MMALMSDVCELMSPLSLARSSFRRLMCFVFCVFCVSSVSCGDDFNERGIRFYSVQQYE